MPEAAAVPELPALQLRRTVSASRERVFRAWTDPDEMKTWLVPEGSRILSVDADVRVGGDYRMTYLTPDRERIYVVGTYVEIDPPARLAFTWMFEGIDRAETLVTIDLHAVGSGTEVVLTHERFAKDHLRALHESGWTSILGRLAELLRSSNT